MVTDDSLSGLLGGAMTRDPSTGSGATLDITERKVAEEAIRRSQAYLAAAQRLSHTGSVGWNLPDGSNSYASSRFVEYCGMHI